VLDLSLHVSPFPESVYGTGEPVSFDCNDFICF